MKDTRSQLIEDLAGLNYRMSRLHTFRQLWAAVDAGDVVESAAGLVFYGTAAELYPLIEDQLWDTIERVNQTTDGVHFEMPTTAAEVQYWMAHMVRSFIRIYGDYLPTAADNLN